MSKTTAKNRRYDDCHDPCGWPGLAMEVVAMALYERDRYFLDHWAFDLWIMIAFDEEIDPALARYALKDGRMKL